MIIIFITPHILPHLPRQAAPGWATAAIALTIADVDGVSGAHTLPSPASNRMFPCRGFPLLFFFFELSLPSFQSLLFPPSSRKPFLTNASPFPANLSTSLPVGAGLPPRSAIYSHCLSLNKDHSSSDKAWPHGDAGPVREGCPLSTTSPDEGSEKGGGCRGGGHLPEWQQTGQLNP